MKKQEYVMKDAHTGKEVHVHAHSPEHAVKLAHKTYKKVY